MELICDKSKFEDEDAEIRHGGEEGEVVDDGLAIEVKAMREEMRKEREEHAKRMDAMLQRLEKTESVLERVKGSVKPSQRRTA